MKIVCGPSFFVPSFRVRHHLLQRVCVCVLILVCRWLVMEELSAVRYNGGFGMAGKVCV